MYQDETYVKKPCIFFVGLRSGKGTWDTDTEVVYIYKYVSEIFKEAWDDFLVIKWQKLKYWTQDSYFQLLKGKKMNKKDLDNAWDASISILITTV